ncbi:hypothetical protein Q7412_07255 [Glaesserella parasuis]|nr:hypothetical protein [Glaesserella parasuis]MDO9967252.1 hypothetical protein [Glaesserella parasuis]MDO9969474.1 hypothetical protein [Glaesserella parasuis]MDO9971587.1 hypothetical protein [Glaesserella parasuis]MDP0007617.1 hypothetical protein [Glaesserella parasuis]
MELQVLGERKVNLALRVQQGLRVNQVKKEIQVLEVKLVLLEQQDHKVKKEIKVRWVR